MWESYKGICEITAITNAQNKTYWHDYMLDKALVKDDDKKLVARKKNAEA
ncbi:hypothetical protein QQ054_30065 [Oscillatoria amoena NRMC-F 0135]|nr:hypothetical protein [Oscillatoria amoena NRMC-F 0135]